LVAWLVFDLLLVEDVKEEKGTKTGGIERPRGEAKDHQKKSVQELRKATKELYQPYSKKEPSPPLKKLSLDNNKRSFTPVAVKRERTSEEEERAKVAGSPSKAKDKVLHVNMLTCNKLSSRCS
jgi:hypothetical protein